MYNKLKVSVTVLTRFMLEAYLLVCSEHKALKSHKKRNKLLGDMGKFSRQV